MEKCGDGLRCRRGSRELFESQRRTEMERWRFGVIWSAGDAL